MADLKLHLLATVVGRQVVDANSKQRNEPDKMVVCQAVEDRLCHHLDLAARADLTDQQVRDALRLLLKIVHRNGLDVEFSPAEISILTQAGTENSSEKGDRSLRVSSDLILGGTSGHLSPASGSTRHPSRTSS